MRTLLAWIGGLALLLAAATGVWWHFADADRRAVALERIGLRQSPLAAATTGLELLQQRRELTVQSARFLTKQVTRRELVPVLPDGLLTSSRTLMVAGTVRYVLDLAHLSPADLSWNAATRTLVVRRPPLLVSEPQFHVQDMSQMEEGRIVLWLTGSEPELDKANWAKASADVRSAAQAPALVESARQSADKALADLFRLPMAAAGFADVKVEIVG